MESRGRRPYQSRTTYVTWPRKQGSENKPLTFRRSGLWTGALSPARIQTKFLPMNDSQSTLTKTTSLHNNRHRWPSGFVPGPYGGSPRDRIPTQAGINTVDVPSHHTHHHDHAMTSSTRHTGRGKLTCGQAEHLDGERKRPSLLASSRHPRPSPQLVSAPVQPLSSPHVHVQSGA